jgi:ubiquinone/menaquinone biosynthesis C-methylase UbiE
MPADFNPTLAYDRAAPRWPGLMARLGYAAAYRRLIADFALTGPVGRVIDIGCGAGDMALALLNAGGRPASLDLCDPSRRMLNLAAGRIGAAGLTPRLQACGLHDLPATAPYDLILCAHVLEHGADLSADLASLARLLAPGGRLLLVASKPHWCNRLIRLRWRHRSFAPAVICAALPGARLTCLNHRGLGPGPPGRTSHAYLITRNPERTRPC